MSDGVPQEGEGGTDDQTTKDVSTTDVYHTVRDSVVVVVLRGPRSGEEIPLDAESTVFGRGDDADVVLDDPGISNRHMRLYEGDASMWIEDLGSSNGTFVNGDRIEAAWELQEGDAIALGSETLLRFTAFTAQTEETASTAGDAKPRVTVGLEGNWFVVGDGEPIDLRRRGSIRRILDALVTCVEERQKGPLDVFELFEVGWPGEEIDPELAADRVYWAIRTLRNEGLSGILVTSDEGYYLAEDVATIERDRERRQPPPQ